MKLKIKKLAVKKDDRGWLAEILRTEDVDGKKFGQILITTAHPGKIKGGHYHLRKREWYCLIKGRGLLILENRKSGERRELEIDDKNMVLVEIPKGVLHSIKNIGQDVMFLLAYTDEPFNPSDPDTYYEEDFQK